MSLSPLQLIFTGALLIILLIQLFYYLHFYIQPLLRLQSEKKNRVHYNTSFPGISVIVYANNNSEQLAQNLPDILNQDYPNFEVIVVNDGSSEETEEVLSQFETNYTNLYHTFLSEEARNLSRKKLSITLGIKAARYDIVLFTNANCRPESNLWINQMARNFTEKTDIVLGFSQLKKQKGMLQRFIAFDLLLRSIRFLSYALTNKAYMGDGTNMAYRKSLFFKNKGFAKFMHLHIGEDDLFINQVATHRNTKVELSKDATVEIKEDNNYDGWRILKLNNAFTASFYKTSAKIVYGFESFTRYLFYAILGCAIYYSIHEVILLSFIITLGVVKIVLQNVFWYQMGRQIGNRKFYTAIPFYELIDPLVNSLFKISSLFHRKRNYTWRI